MKSKKTTQKRSSAKAPTSAGARSHINAKSNASGSKPNNAKKAPVRKRRRLIKTDLTPFILLAVSLLAETCFLLAEQSGAVGMLVHKLFFGLFGAASYFIPVGLLLVAFFYKDLKERGVLRFKLIILPVFTVVLSVTVTLIAQNGLKDAAFSFKEFWVTGTLSESGGVFGGVFGMIFSKIFGAAASAVIAVIATLALLSFGLGKTRLGIWKIFTRNKNGEPSEPATENRPAPKHVPVPMAAARRTESAQLTVPRRIDTLLSEEEPKQAPRIPNVSSQNPSPFLYDFSEDEDEVLAPSAKGYRDGIQSNGVLTDLEDDTFFGNGDDLDAPEGLRKNYRPADLMTDFGFREEAPRKAEKVDIYDETGDASPTPLELPKITPTPAPKPAPKASYYTEPSEPPKAYSPFATLLSREEFFSGKGAEKNYATPKKSPSSTVPSGETRSYSPFADPLASMNAPRRSPGDIPPQSIIAAGQEKMWEEMREQAKAIEEEQKAAAEAAQAALKEQYAQLAAPAPQYTAQPQSAQSGFGTASDISGTPRSELYSRNPMDDFSPAPSAPKPARQFDIPEVPKYESVMQMTEAPAQPSAPAVSETPTPSFSAFPERNAQAPQAPASRAFSAQPSAPISVQTSAPVTPKTVPAMPMESRSSAFDADVTAPEQEDESAASIQEYDDGRDPRVINPFSRYTKLRYPRYVKPPTSLLDMADDSKRISEQEIHEVMRKILEKFESFHVDAAVTGYSAGPSITRYEVTPGPGVKVKQITGLAEDIGLALQSESVKGEVRIVTVPGKSVIGIEVPNSVVSTVSLRSLIENPDFQKAKSKITVCVGLTVSGKPVYMNIDEMPHVLVAGQTKSGKSVAINAMIMSMIYRASPDEVQFILIDPKQVELSIYNDIPHMIMPVIDDPKRAAGALQWAVAEMERRYTLIKNARVRDREEYYKTREQNPDFEYMPQIIIIIDELADLMLQVREHVEEPINRLAAKARACGMNLVIGTQRPSTDIVTGLIKANIPSKIAFRVASNVDSRVILGNVGAEKLLGRGDMLYHPTGGSQIRAQGAFVDTAEIKRVLDFIIENNGAVEYDPEILYRLQSETDKLTKTEKKAGVGGGDDDYAVDTADIDFDYLCQAIELVINLGKATTNVIQRHLKIGFNRASNIVDKLEELGFISGSNGSSKPRDVLVNMQSYLEWKNSHQK